MLSVSFSATLPYIIQESMARFCQLNFLFCELILPAHSLLMQAGKSSHFPINDYITVIISIVA